MESLGQHSVTGLSQRKRKDRATNHASIHKSHLKRTVAPPLPWLGDPTTDSDALPFKRGHRNQFSKKFLPVQIPQTNSEILRGG